MVAAGDIACDPADSHFSGGVGTSAHCQQAATAALIAQIAPRAVLALGDDQYEAGALAAFQASYGPSWGAFKTITHPVPGNNEYQGTSADGYFAYFGAAAGPPGKGYYSFDLGSWHLIALNGNCSEVGGCSEGSPQEQWLRQDLERSSARCTLAMWHQPRFYGSKANGFASFWDDLYTHGVEVVLNGHHHVYQRFQPQTPSGTVDTAEGITEFIVGTGGEDHGTLKSGGNAVATSEDTFGVLKMTLSDGGYSWSYVPVTGGAFTDAGSASCH